VIRIAAGAALAVAVCWLAAFAIDGVRPLTMGAFRIAAADALLFEAMLLAVAAPVAGVGLASVAGVARAAGAFTLLSLAAALAAALVTGAPLPLVIRGHATLAAVAFALGALGVLCATRLRDPLDAAGLAIVTSVVLSAAMLVAGPATAAWPQALVDAGLLASPPIAISSSAGLDLLRSAVLYELSPIAHRRFTYPAWQTASLTYTAAALVFAIGTIRNRSQNT
jgi:hypothetical protein